MDELLTEYESLVNYETRELKKAGKTRKEIEQLIEKFMDWNGNIDRNFFYEKLGDEMKVGEMTFDDIDRNKNRYNKKLKLRDEFDVVLINSDSILITEVKYKAIPDHVDELLNKKIPNFKKLFPHYKDFKIYAAIAGLAMPADTIKNATKNGFFVLTQSGDNIKLLNDKVKCY